MCASCCVCVSISSHTVNRGRQSYPLGPEVEFFSDQLAKLSPRERQEVDNLIDAT